MLPLGLIMSVSLSRGPLRGALAPTPSTAGMSALLGGKKSEDESERESG